MRLTGGLGGRLPGQQAPRAPAPANRPVGGRRV